MSDTKRTLPPISVAHRNLLNHEIMKPAAVARVAALPAVSDYARREGMEVPPVRTRLIRYA